MAETVKFVFYDYKPSLAAAVIFIILFTCSAAYHVFLMVKHKTWYFIPFIIGCLFEAVGYVGRAMSSTEYPDFTTNPYIIQSVLLLLGPTLYAASIYMILGRLVRLLDADNYAIIKPRWLTKLFVFGDVLSFFIQGGGGGIMTSAKDQSTVNTGQNVILVGLVVQILFFGFFIVVTGVFHRRIHENPTPTSLRIQVPWLSLLLTLYVTSLFIMVRSIYRVIEYGQGQTGALMSNETWLYVFDSTPMIIVALIMNWMHPSRVIRRDEAVKASIYVMEDGTGPLTQSHEYS